jgi:hypothetical protein
MAKFLSYRCSSDTMLRIFGNIANCISHSRGFETYWRSNFLAFLATCARVNSSNEMKQLAFSYFTSMVAIVKDPSRIWVRIRLYVDHIDTISAKLTVALILRCFAKSIEASLRSTLFYLILPASFSISESEYIFAPKVSISPTFLDWRNIAGVPLNHVWRLIIVASNILVAWNLYEGIR